MKSCDVENDNQSTRVRADRQTDRRTDGQTTQRATNNTTYDRWNTDWLLAPPSARRDHTQRSRTAQTVSHHFHVYQQNRWLHTLIT